MYTDGIGINTTQNVLVSYQPASVGERILAALLDFVFLLAYFLLALVIFSAFASLSMNSSMSILAAFSIITLPVFTYSLYMEQFFGGQTLGKKIMKIKVVRVDGSQPTLGSYFIRWILRLIDIVISNGGVAVIFVGFSEKSQRLGDMAAGTTVVTMKQKVSLKNTILYKTPSDYKIMFQEVSKLTDKDVGIIKDVFDHCNRTGDASGLMQLSKKVKTKMGVTSTLRDEQFVKVVLMDYSQYQFEK